MEIEISFTDITLSETDGIFDEVEKIMLKEIPHNKDWMLRTNTTISSEHGTGEMILNFYGDKKIMIMEYKPSIGDVFYNPDIQALTMWAQDSGWNIPQPNAGLVKSNKEFWKHFYDVLLIDSDYFDSIYGKRPQLGEDEDGH